MCFLSSGVSHIIKPLKPFINMRTNAVCNTNEPSLATLKRFWCPLQCKNGVLECTETLQGFSTSYNIRYVAF